MRPPLDSVRLDLLQQLYMGGVDLSNRKISHVSAERPTRRYWKKVFFNLLDMALLNTYELYRANTDAAQYKSRHDYLCAVVESLCDVEEPILEMQTLRQRKQHHLSAMQCVGTQDGDVNVPTYDWVAFLGDSYRVITGIPGRQLPSDRGHSWETATE